MNADPNWSAVTLLGGIPAYNRISTVATSTVDIERMLPATLTFPDMSEQEFLDLCGKFPEATLEYEPDGTLIIMPPTDPESGARGASLIYELMAWSRRVGGGMVVGPDAGFFLRDGSRRSPDAAWFDKNRWQAAKTPGTRFPRFAPDFVVELRSPNDRLSAMTAKMHEYIANGVRLAWQLDPQNRTVTIYRPGTEPQVLNNPTEVTGDGPVAGFVLPLAEIF